MKLSLRSVLSHPFSAAVGCRPVGALALCLLVASGAVACAAPTADADEAMESDLRALSSSEIVGSIAYGETKSIAYTRSGRATYRALKFKGVAGDTIDVWVRGRGDADARVWLLDASFATKARNDNASRDTLDAHVKTKLTRTGDFYIAVRDNAFDDAAFAVSLAREGDVQPPPPPPAVSDPFDPAFCSADLLTQEDLLRYLPAGASRVRVGDYSVVTRLRTCTRATGCSPWGGGAGLELFRMISFTQNSFSERLPLTSGTLDLIVSDRASSPLEFDLGLPPVSPVSSRAQQLRCEAPGLCSLRLQGALTVLTGESVHPSKNKQYTSDVTFTSNVGRGCFVARLDNRVDVDNQRYTEAEAAIVGKLIPLPQ